MKNIIIWILLASTVSFGALANDNPTDSLGMMMRCSHLADKLKLGEKYYFFRGAANVLYLKKEGNELGVYTHGFDSGYQVGYIDSILSKSSDTAIANLYYALCEKGLLKYAKDLTAK